MNSIIYKIKLKLSENYLKPYFMIKCLYQWVLRFLYQGTPNCFFFCFFGWVSIIYPSSSYFSLKPNWWGVKKSLSSKYLPSCTVITLSKALVIAKLLLVQVILDYGWTWNQTHPFYKQEYFWDFQRISK